MLSISKVLHRSNLKVKYYDFRVKKNGGSSHAVGQADLTLDLLSQLKIKLQNRSKRASLTGKYQTLEKTSEK